MSTGADWSPAAYARFRDLRLRPALDLLAQVGPVPDGPVFDLGCGNGAVGPALAAQFAGRLTGLDSSPAMLTKAAETGCYDRLEEADIAGWSPEQQAALIFSNAALQWLPDHAALMPHLLRQLAPGGVLAVQMPRNHPQPSHRFLRDIAASMYPDRFPPGPADTPVMPSSAYWQMLHGHAAVEAWETDYLQHLSPAPQGHPVRAFTESTAMRRYLDRMTATEAVEFTAAYDAALAAAYPLLPDGSALFPFRRLFFVARI